MTDNTSIRYAIRLPNGELAHDLPSDVKSGYPKRESLPNGDEAWLWSDLDEHHARNTIRNIARLITHWGLADVFTENTSVVMVRTTVEILDGDRDTEPAVERPEPTWKTVEDVPIGRTFVPAVDPLGSYTFKRGPDWVLQLIDGGNLAHQSTDELNTRYPDGFTHRPGETVEDAPKAEPRTWIWASSVPHLVPVKVVGDDSNVTWKHDALAGRFYPYCDGEFYGDSISRAEADSMATDGFVEVLS
ncbi:hypothetical protein IU449_26940 [Nocardia higoensis]|uniref:Uncharacterized protein n=1 Tax=Nocardia higoensis TaxID=228599 RepID=A0ABS0DI50_9NOCA|nr:hypothetical protein [Nocardia higoensis]MBF6358137.1 hypothetical protein [Nocardia higoensis]